MAPRKPLKRPNVKKPSMVKKPAKKVPPTRTGAKKAAPPKKSPYIPKTDLGPVPGKSVAPGYNPNKPPAGGARGPFPALPNSKGGGYHKLQYRPDGTMYWAPDTAAARAAAKRAPARKPAPVKKAAPSRSKLPGPGRSVAR